MLALTLASSFFDPSKNFESSQAIEDWTGFWPVWADKGQMLRAVIFAYGLVLAI